MAFDHDRLDPIPKRFNTAAFWRSIPVRVTVMATAAVVLASCASSTPSSSSSPVQGVPTIGVSVALQQVACTLGDSCVAVGASSASLGPSAVGEYRRASGHWTSIAMPSVSAAQIVSSSCWRTDCLFGGAQSSGDLLWDYSASSHSVSSVTPPSGGVGVSAISCYDTLSCVLIDDHFSGQPRFFETIDGGATWTTPIPVPWAAGSTVSTLACTSATDCLAVSTSTTGPVRVEVTLDAGVTWTARTIAASWTAVSSLQCHARNCDALVTTSDGSRLVRSNSFGRQWSATTLPVSASAAACTLSTRCVVIGQDTSQKPWLGQVASGTVAARSLQYVPSSLLDVACGTKICAAIGATTLLSWKP